MKMKVKFAVYIVFILLSFSCSAPAVNDENHWWTLWLDNPSCLAPCWQGITPGITTTEQATSILKKIPGVEFTYTGEYGVSWKFNENDTDSGDLRVSENGVVSTIWIGNSIDKDLFLETIITSQGEPAYLEMYDCRLLDNEKAMCPTILVYPNKGLLIDVFLEDTGEAGTHEINIQPSAIVSGVYFMKPGIENFKALPEFQEYELLEWKGYTVYSSIVP
jgi:hypothetical protein